MVSAEIIILTEGKPPPYREFFQNTYIFFKTLAHDPALAQKCLVFLATKYICFSEIHILLGIARIVRTANPLDKISKILGVHVQCALRNCSVQCASAALSTF